MIIRKLLLMSLLMAVVAGCGGKPAHSQRYPDEIREGPGMFSGSAGSFTLYDSEKKGDKSEKVAAQQSPSSTDARDFEEFRDYQEFLRWKEKAKGTPEYRDFQDWREWRSYKSWKDRQGK
jgi:hypothetical protein